MKKSLLLPSQYKIYGWILFLISAILGYFALYEEFKIPGFQLIHRESTGLLDFSDYNLTNEIALIGVIIGLLLVCFAKEKQEDEFIAYLRLQSWQWSVLVSYLILIVITLFVYGSNFFAFLFYNAFTILFVFILKFNLRLYQSKREGDFDEK